jgi:acyl-CoA thioesterase II
MSSHDAGHGRVRGLDVGLRRFVICGTTLPQITANCSPGYDLRSRAQQNLPHRRGEIAERRGSSLRHTSRNTDPAVTSIARCGLALRQHIRPHSCWFFLRAPGKYSRLRETFRGAFMDQRLADLLRLLELERLEINLFRGESRDIGAPQVFGGQVLGQALVAASATVEERMVHSLHAYFLRPGDFTKPIVYEVDRSRDGLSFSNRRVIAIQNGQQIFNMAASFQAAEQGLEHQLPMPAAPKPESLPDLMEQIRGILDLVPQRVRRFVRYERPFEFRPVLAADLRNPMPMEPHKVMWFRAVDKVPDDQALHRCLLAYVSDFHLLDTAMMPHAVSAVHDTMRLASIDHAMWFHADVRVDDWLLYVIDSPSASGAKGFTRGSIFSRDGKLVASTAQEGLIRLLARGESP